MGLLTQIATFPLAPVRGVGWVLDKIVMAAEDQLYDPGPVQEQLSELERARTEGRIEDEEFEQREDELMARLQEISAHQLQQEPSSEL
ncbi:gas vesicle protein GvpG [Streptomyces sp. NPDC001530]|uniref:gas vesicle protein GvpG n=1 Tax=Streptomyces sp. NPDC001530 TaxID=3364582 RepID=UPI00368653C8